MDKQQLDFSEGWILFKITTYLPLLEILGSGGQPGLYSCKWGHNDDGKKVQLLIRSAHQTKEYPHLTIDFDPNTGAVAWFHYSPKQHSKNRVGASEFIILFQALYPALRTMQADVLISLLTTL